MSWADRHRQTAIEKTICLPQLLGKVGLEFYIRCEWYTFLGSNLEFSYLPSFSMGKPLKELHCVKKQTGSHEHCFSFTMAVTIFRSPIFFKEKKNKL